ncbi:MAG: hypothetical protein IPH91_05745 [Elusimicrobia bacterium]|nr:hypothetical protein [Elusimicrobiota bacterium]
MKLYLVAYIDLLGQSDRLKEFPLFPPAKDYAEKYEVPYRILSDFRTSIRSLSDSIGRQDIPSEIRSKLSNTDLSLMRDLCTYDIGFEFIGDAALLKLSLDESAGRKPLLGIERTLTQVSLLILNGLAEKNPVRCAIDIGLCREMDGGLYGQAVASAYNLERQEADFPRAMIGSYFIDYLDYYEVFLNKQMQDENWLIQKAYMKGIRSSLRKESNDQNHSLDYLAGFKGKTDSLVTNAYQFIQESLEKYKADGDQKLLKRYERVERYFKDSGFGDK